MSDKVDPRTAWKIVATVVVVVVAVSGLLYASMKEEAQFWKYADEVMDNPAAFQGMALNVGGFVAVGSLKKVGLDYTFVIETRPPRKPVTLKAHFRGLVPDTFKEGGEVVATGRLAMDNRLEAEKLMAKCPSKYDAKSEGADLMTPPVRSN